LTVDYDRLLSSVAFKPGAPVQLAILNHDESDVVGFHCFAGPSVVEEVYPAPRASRPPAPPVARDMPRTKNVLRSEGDAARKSREVMTQTVLHRALVRSHGAVRINQPHPPCQAGRRQFENLCRIPRDEDLYESKRKISITQKTKRSVRLRCRRRFGRRRNRRCHRHCRCHHRSHARSSSRRRRRRYAHASL